MTTAWLVTLLMITSKGTEKQCLWEEKIKSATGSYGKGGGKGLPLPQSTLTSSLIGSNKYFSMYYHIGTKTRVFLIQKKMICFPRNVFQAITEVSLSVITWAFSISGGFAHAPLFEKGNSDSSQEEILPSQIIDSVMKAYNIRPLINRIPFSN